MDYTGIGRFISFPLGRLLSPEESEAELARARPASTRPLDWLSLIRLNSTYIELVDRWYPGKGTWTWMGGLIGLPCALALGALLYFIVDRGSSGDWMLAALGVPAFGAFAWIAYSMIRTESFRQTHYPIRLNRKTRMVYAFRPDGSILQVPWDDLFLCVLRNALTMGQASHDVRAHVLAEDGKTVVDTFTLAYHEYDDRDSLMQLWEYIRRYMEEPDGVEQCYRNTTLCLPIDGRREGLAFGIVRVFAMAAHHPVAQLVMSPLAALNVLGRWAAMYTSRVPRWPDEVEAACQVEPDDPWRKDWRSNGGYGFYELWWPVICFVIGLGVLAVGAGWLVKALL